MGYHRTSFPHRVPLNAGQVLIASVVLTAMLLLTAAAAPVAAVPVSAPDAPGFTIEVTSQETMWVDANKCGAEGPRGAWLSFWVTNSSGMTLDDVTVTLSNFTGTVPAGNTYFKATQDPVRWLQTMADGEVEAVYFYVDYSAICTAANLSGNQATYTLTVSTSTSGYGPDVYNGTVSSSLLITASAGGLVVQNVIGPGVFVGQLLWQEVTYEFNNNKDLFFQPASQASFDDRCLRLADMEVVAVDLSVDGITVGDSDNRLWFPDATVKPSVGNGSVTMRYYWEVLCMGATQTAAPWSAASSGQQYKYQAVGAPATINAPTPSLVASKSAPVCVPYDTSAEVVYTVVFTNITGVDDVDAYLKEIRDVLPNECFKIKAELITEPGDLTVNQGNTLIWPAIGDPTSTSAPWTVEWVSKYNGWDPLTNIQGWRIAPEAPNNTLTLKFTIDLSTCPKVTTRYRNVVTGYVGNGDDTAATRITATNDFYYPCSPAAVSLAGFSAEATAGGVTLAWETVSEADNAGFNLFRGESAEGPWAQVNAALIPAQTPGAATGGSYAFTDAGAPQGVMLWYALEDVSLSGATTRHAPVSVTLAGPNAVRMSGFGAASTAAWPALAGLAAVAGLAAAGFARRRDD